MGKQRSSDLSRVLSAQLQSVQSLTAALSAGRRAPGAQRKRRRGAAPSLAEQTAATVRELAAESAQRASGATYAANLRQLSLHSTSQSGERVLQRLLKRK